MKSFGNEQRSSDLSDVIELITRLSSWFLFCVVGLHPFSMYKISGHKNNLNIDW